MSQHVIKKPGLLQVLGGTLHKGQLGILLELMPGGSLQQAIWHRAVPWGPQAAQIAAAAAQGLEFLHSRGFTHGNLKSRNVLLNK